MKFTIFFLLLFVVQLSASVYSQQTRLKVDFNQATIKDVLKEIENQTGLTFFYSGNVMDIDQKVTLSSKSMSLDDMLLIIREQTGLSFSVVRDQILVKQANGVNQMQQNLRISGKVTDSSGLALPGVTVVVKGTTRGTITDGDGSYTLADVATGSTLVFSFVGMETQEIFVSGENRIDVVLNEESIGLEEVVAIGYGTQKKRDIVGSMTSVKGDEITKISAANLANGLQGLASGVMVNSTSGHPGAAPEIKIRGINSINLSSSPLWIVDGMPIFTGSSEISREGVKGVSAISMINPNDIESIEVLKDAAATAIYGNRASGGVILVTTKSAKKDKTGVKVTYDGGVSQIPFSQNDIFVDSKTWWDLNDKAAENYGVVPSDPNSIIAIQFWGDRPEMTKEEAIATNTDHLRSITQNAVFHQFGMTANKSFNKGGVLFSLNYRDEEGLIRNNDFQRLTSRFNFNFKPIESMEVGINSNFIYLKTNGVRSVQGKGNGGWANWQHTLPWWKVYDETSQTGYWAVNSGYNMVAFSDHDLTRYDVDQYRGINNAYIDWSPISDLRIRGDLGADVLVNNSSFWRSGLLAPTAPFQSIAEEQSVTKTIVNYSLYANYVKSINEIHDIDLTVGTEATRHWSYTRQFAGSGLQSVYPELRNPLQMNSMAGYQGGDTYLMGFFARANYKLKNRYLLNVSARRDGHSAFNKDNRWANFYAVGAGWILTDEPFMQGIEFLNMLKLRGSYGITGNTNVSNSMTYMSWGLSTSKIWGVGTANGATTVGPLGSADLRWETTANYDFGLDFGLLKNRINGSIAYYTQNIDDLILRGNVQPSVGYNSNQIYENIGDMKNWGIEFNVSSVNIEKSDFSWRTDFNISTNKNKIIRLNEAEKGKGKENSQTIRKEGEAINTWYLANYVNVDSEKGIYTIEGKDAELWDNEFRTVSSGNIIPATNTNVTNNRMIQHGKTPLPTFYGGLNNTLTYKNFDMSVMIYFEGGNWIENSLYETGTRVGSEFNNVNDLVGNTWEKPGDNAKYAYLLPGNPAYFYDNDGNPTKTRISYNVRQTTKFLEKGDFVKLRNIQLGYTLPRSVLNSSSISSLRLYVGATNLFTITGYNGLDPETQSDLPVPRTFKFGVSLNL